LVVLSKEVLNRFEEARPPLCHSPMLPKITYTEITFNNIALDLDSFIMKILITAEPTLFRVLKHYQVQYYTPAYTPNGPNRS
jgi:hypothetical protein